VGNADPEVIKQRSRSVSLSKSLPKLPSDTSAIVEQTPDGISVRRLSVMRSRSSFSAQQTTASTPMTESQKMLPRVSFMLFRMPSMSKSSSRYSSEHKDSLSSSIKIPNFRQEHNQKLSSYAVTMSVVTLRFTPALSSDMDSGQVRRA
ncbi:hypothetical protein BVRB_041370, partial [Beta vulgaris subsp. vulgaris]